VKRALVIREQVWREIEEAAEWYRARNPELKNRFVKAVNQAIDRLVENPRLGSRRLRKVDLRWVRAKRFPYRIIYRLHPEDETVVVLMLLHSSREDRHWQKLLKPD
jgi:toxin ParE1/3/4